MTFEYGSHNNVKSFLPFMREMIKQVKNNADDTKLSHQVKFNDLKNSYQN
jgi:hypothetical protein